MRHLNRNAWPIQLVRWGSLISLLVIAQQTILAVNHIECTLSSGATCTEQILSTLNQIKGQPLLFNNLEQKISQLEFDHPVQAQVVSKHLPQTLTLQLTQEPGLYRIDQNDYLITESGFVFSGSDKEIVTVQFPQGVFDGQILDMSVHQTVVNLIKSLTEYQIHPKTIIWISSEEIKLKLDNGLEVIVDSVSAQTVGEKLELIMNSEILESFDFDSTQVDLRFRLPVLRKTT